MAPPSFAAELAVNVVSADGQVTAVAVDRAAVALGEPVDLVGLEQIVGDDDRPLAGDSATAGIRGVVLIVALLTLSVVLVGAKIAPPSAPAPAATLPVNVALVTFAVPLA